MDLWSTDLRVPGSYDAAFEDERWLEAFRAHVIQKQGRRGEVEIAVYERLRTGVTSMDDIHGLLRQCQWSARVERLLNDVVHGYSTDVDDVAAAAQAEVGAVVQKAWATFAADAQDEIESTLDLKKIRELNAGLLKDTDVGGQLYWFLLDPYFVLSSVAAVRSSHFYAWMIRNGAAKGSLEVQARGKGTDPGKIKVWGADDERAFKDAIRELTKKRIVFADEDEAAMLADPDDLVADVWKQDADDQYLGGEVGPAVGAPDAPAPSQQDQLDAWRQDDGSVPPRTLHEAWEGPWAPVFRDWCDARVPVFTCLDTITEFEGNPSDDVAAYIWGTWISPEAYTRIPIAPDIAERIAERAQDGQPADLYDEAKPALWSLAAEEYAEFVSLYE